MSKKKTPAGDQVERTLPFTLNDEQKARKAELAASLSKKLDDALEAKKEEMSKHNAKIKDLTGKISVQLKMINEGIERKPVTCTAVKNYDANVIEYWFEGQVLENQPMKDTDRQLKLDEKAPKKKGEDRWQKLAPKHGRKGDPPTTGEEVKAAEIASVHKLETSRSGASSMVDPK